MTLFQNGFVYGFVSGAATVIVAAGLWWVIYHFFSVLPAKEAASELMEYFGLK